MSIYYKLVTFVIITGVLISGVVVPIPIIPSLGDSARIIFFHVPMAWLAVLAFCISMIFSIKFLKYKDIIYDIKAFSS